MANLNNRIRGDRLSEAQMKEAMYKQESQRKVLTEKLQRKWERIDNKLTSIDGRKVKTLDEIAHENPKKLSNMLLLLENAEKMAKKLIQEAGNVSGNYTVTPENLVKVFRYAYPNMIGSDIVVEYPMTHWNDSMYFVEPLAVNATRGASASTMIYENFGDYGSPKELSRQLVATGNASDTNFTGTLTVKPAVPGTFSIYAGTDTASYQRVAYDDGDGNFVTIGSNYALHSSTASTIDYTTGAWDITFAAAPATGIKFYAEYHYDTENSSLFTQQQEIKLSVRRLMFEPVFQSLGLTWTRLSEFAFDTSFGESQQEILINSAIDWFRKSADEEKIARLARIARNQTNTGLTFNADWTSSSAAGPREYAYLFKGVVSKAEQLMRSAKNRGIVNRLICANDAANYIKNYVDGFIPENNAVSIGAYKLGTLDGVPVYTTNSTAVTDDYGIKGGEIIAEYIDFNTNGDTPLVYGVYGGIVDTQAIEYKNFNSEKGLGQMTSVKENIPQFTRLITLENL